MKQKGKRFIEKENTNKKAKSAQRYIDDVDNDYDVELDIDTDESDVVTDTSTADTVVDTQIPKVITKAQKRKMIMSNKRDSKKTNKQSEPISVKSKRSIIKHKERVVLSYEDLPLDNSGNSRLQKSLKTVKKNRKRIVMSAVIILVLALLVLLFANRDRFTFSNIKNWVEYGILNVDSEEHFPVATNGAVINNGNFTRIDSNLAFASDTHFATINNYGRTIYSAPQSYSSPVLVTAADCDLSLVYNLGGIEFSVNSLDSNIYSGEAEENIIVADISKNGVYALVTEKDGYLSKLYVYSSDNKQIYAYSFADYYITSVSLDSKGKSAVLSGISAHDGTQISAIYVLDFTKEDPVVFEEFTSNVIYQVSHLSDNYICIIGENAAYTLNIRKKSFVTTNYDGKTLTAFDINTDTNNFVLSLSRSGDGRMCDIFTFSQTGVHKNTISTDLMITSLSSYKNRVAALSGDTVYLYSKDDVLISQTDAGLDPHCIVLYSTTDAYVLGVSEIRRLDL